MCIYDNITEAYCGSWNDLKDDVDDYDDDYANNINNVSITHRKK